MNFPHTLANRNQNRLEVNPFCNATLPAKERSLAYNKHRACDGNKSIQINKTKIKQHSVGNDTEANISKNQLKKNNSSFLPAHISRIKTRLVEMQV